MAISVDSALRARTAAGFSGSVMLARRDRAVLLAGYGTADREREIPASGRTLFHLGSLSKQFTAAAILLLDGDGALSLSDSIARHFPDVLADKHGITIHQLLTHTAGLPSSVGACRSGDESSRDEFVRRVLAADLTGQPGAGYQYSNAGYALLGALVETASGMPMEQFVRTRLFAPAGMHSTGFTFGPEERTRGAIGYDEQGGPHPVLLDPAVQEAGIVWCNAGSGGVLSTAEDMFSWYRALRDGTVLPTRSLEMMLTGYAAEDAEATSFYGYGWALSTTTRGTRLVSHNGNIAGYLSADFRWYRDDDVALFVASSTQQHDASTIAADISRLLFR